jgi:hypothetical protein
MADWVAGFVATNHITYKANLLFSKKFSSSSYLSGLYAYSDALGSPAPRQSTLYFFVVFLSSIKRLTAYPNMLKLAISEPAHFRTTIFFKDISWRIQ